VWKVVYLNDFQIKQLEPLHTRGNDLICLLDAGCVREQIRVVTGNTIARINEVLDRYTKLTPDRYLHVRMTVDVPSTFRRYPGVMITTTPFKEVDDPTIQHVYDLPVTSRLGPLADEGSGNESTILVHPFGYSDLQLQFCDRRGWGVGDQCKKANTQGRRTHWENNGQPWLPVPVLGHVAGEDRPVQFDIYASTDKIFLFQDDQPAGCARLPSGRMPASTP